MRDGMVPTSTYGVGPGTPPTPTLGGGLSCPFVAEEILLRSGGKHRGPFSRPEDLVPDPPLGACKGGNGQSRTLERA